MTDWRAITADITALDVDTIVNAANVTLLGGGGVDGAIHRAAGPELVEACRPLAPCPTGEARITPGFRLQARHVIHCVGPIWQGGHACEPALLAACYRNSLDLARNASARSVAFPAISTGVYGYPKAAAAAIAAQAAADWIEATPGALDTLLFVGFDDAATMLYAAAIARSIA
jgi:O-acetyl-ADP-ribose deacetylase